MILLPLAFWLGYYRYYRRGRPVPLGRWLLRALALMGPLSIVAMEAGWMVTELGRQPWIIYNLMLVQDGVTTVPGLGITFILFAAIYVLLAVTLIVLLLRLASDQDAFVLEKEAEVSGT